MTAVHLGHIEIDPIAHGDMTCSLIAHCPAPSHADQIADPDDIARVTCLDCLAAAHRAALAEARAIDDRARVLAGRAFARGETAIEPLIVGAVTERAGTPRSDSWTARRVPGCRVYSFLCRCGRRVDAAFGAVVVCACGEALSVEWVDATGPVAPLGRVP